MTSNFPKYLERTISSPGLVVFHEKHSERYFYCKTREDYFKMALHVLKGRLKDDYWYFDEEYTEEELTIQKSASYLGTTNKPRELQKDETLAKQIVKSKRGDMAYCFLRDRGEYEYERMTIEQLEDY